MGMGMGPGYGLGGGYARPAEETVINNYYEEPGNRGFEHDRPEGERHFHETADQGGAQFSDASYKTTGDDRTAFDDSIGGDDSSGLSGGGGDPGMGFDDGGFDGNDSGDLV
jgi:hypothetical protein